MNWNLPPGCSPNDIPGNRPIDLAWERAYEEAADELGDLCTCNGHNECMGCRRLTARAEEIMEEWR